MADFGNLIALAARDRAPFRLTHYAQDLASLFHQFYTNCHVLTDDADVQTARLAPLRRHPHRAGLDAEPAGRVGSGEDVGLASLRRLALE